jgi:arylsulfatase A-like enzyme
VFTQAAVFQFWVPEFFGQRVRMISRIGLSPLVSRLAFILLLPILMMGHSVAIANQISSPMRPATSQPNIVLIFADDLGWKDVGYQSEGTFLTPHIDQLARDGMVFTNAYASAGNCAPSRACLLSGRYTPAHHLFAVGSTERGPKELMRLDPVPNRDGLASRFVTMAERLRSAGYATGHFGKWHLAGKDGALPSQQGFDVTFDSFGDGVRPEGSEGNRTGPAEDPKGVFTLTRKACEFIEANRDVPFFCYLPHHAIHTPLQVRAETRTLFEKSTDASIPSVVYRGCTYDLDASVGSLISKLRELGLEKNTLVIFTSDNGATKGSSQEPLRGNKGGYYEGGIREPFIAYWPGQITADQVCDVPIINVDLYPTFLDVAGVITGQSNRANDPDDVSALDGESILPLLTGQANGLARESIFWHFPGYLDRPVTRGRDPVFRTRPVSVIRKGDWKLHLYHEPWLLDGGLEKLAENDAIELYNLREDIGERHNLALANPAKRDELLQDLLAWFDRSGAPLPTPK